MKLSIIDFNGSTVRLTLFATCIFVSSEMLAARRTNAATFYSAVDDFSNTANTETTTWSYRYSDDLVRDDDYPLLSENNDTIPLWDPPTPYWHTSATAYPPAVGVNSSGGPIPVDANFQTFDWPNNTVWMHPGDLSLSVVSWLSPANKTIRVEFSFADIDSNGGNGVNWFVDLNDSSGSLAAGQLANGATSGFQVFNGVVLSAGDRLNFVIDPNGPHAFDSTAVTIEIASIPEPSSFASGTCITILLLTLLRLRSGQRHTFSRVGDASEHTRIKRNN